MAAAVELAQTEAWSIMLEGGIRALTPSLLFAEQESDGSGLLLAAVRRGNSDQVHRLVRAVQGTAMRDAVLRMNQSSQNVLHVALAHSDPTLLKALVDGLIENAMEPQLRALSVQHDEQRQGHSAANPIAAALAKGRRRNDADIHLGHGVRSHDVFDGDDGDGEDEYVPATGNCHNTNIVFTLTHC